MRKIKFIIGSPKNWRAYRKIRLEALRSEPASYRNSYRDMLKLSVQDWKRRLADSNSVICLAKLTGEIIAMGGILFSQIEKNSHVAKIFEIYVNPKYRKMGIGKNLLNTIENTATGRGIIKLQLLVNTKSGCAISLYEQFGFKKVGCLKKELKIKGKYFDEYIMEKIIRGNE